MSDHLTRLAARALGLAETVRPRRTLFEPQRVMPEPTSSGDRDAEPIPAATRSPVAETRRADVVGASPGSPEQPARPERAEHVEPVETEQVSTPIDPSPEPPPTRSEPVASLPEGPERREQAIIRHTTEQVIHAQAPADPPMRRTAPVVTRRAQLLGSRPPSRLEHPNRESQQPPTVRVTIGRVDVRAVAPEQPAERRPKQTPRMSLDEYLSRDRSGAR